MLAASRRFEKFDAISQVKLHCSQVGNATSLNQDPPEVIQREQGRQFIENFLVQRLENPQVLFQDLDGSDVILSAQMRPVQGAAEVKVLDKVDYRLSKCPGGSGDLSRASKYFCLRISKYILSELPLSSMLVNPAR